MPTPWHLGIALDSGSSTPLSLQLTRQVADAVRSGRLRRGTLLPGTRTLARALGVSRNTITAAYEELSAEGFLESDGPAGTRISRHIPDPSPAPSARAASGALGFALEPFGVQALDAPGDRRLLRWDFGLPDPRLAPRIALARAYARVMRRRPEVLQYARYLEAPGAPLEKAVGQMLSSTRGLDAGPGRIAITRGSQMGLYLAIQCLVRPGDRVAIEHPGFVRAWETLRAAGAELVPIPVDAEGLSLSHLERRLARGPLRAVFLTPHHQFPTTATLSLARRLELLRLAARHRFAILEDDYDHEYHYDARPILPLASTDPAGVVIYLGSLSKIFAPGLRTGFVVAPPPVISALSARRALIDVQDDLALELAVAELFEEGEIQRHQRRSRRIYRQRRDFMVGLIRKKLGSALDFTIPSGGLALWAKVDPSIDVERWEEASRRRGVGFRTGRLFFQGGQAQPFVRLGFARLDAAEAEHAVKTVARALQDT
ncbi:MAG: PLP-dependent aminotransferase family protein [Myxococcota bacterium]